mgnify:CR=1 FL=1
MIARSTLAATCTRSARCCTDAGGRAAGHRPHRSGNDRQADPSGRPGCGWCGTPCLRESTTAVARALAKVPADRFGSAGEFARALALPVTASSGDDTRRRRWIPVAVVGVVVLALAPAVGIALRRRPAVVSTVHASLRAADHRRQRPDSRTHRMAPGWPTPRATATSASSCTDQPGGARHRRRGIHHRVEGAARSSLPAGAAEGRFLISGSHRTRWSLENRRGVCPGRHAMVATRLGVGVVGVTDTPLVSPGLRPASDSVSWLRIVTISDGLVRIVSRYGGQPLSKSGSGPGRRPHRPGQQHGGRCRGSLDGSVRTDDGFAAAVSHASELSGGRRRPTRCCCKIDRGSGTSAVSRNRAARRYAASISGSAPVSPDGKFVGPADLPCCGSSPAARSQVVSEPTGRRS